MNDDDKIINEAIRTWYEQENGPTRELRVNDDTGATWGDVVVIMLAALFLVGFVFLVVR